MLKNQLYTLFTTQWLPICNCSGFRWNPSDQGKKCEFACANDHFL